MSVQRRYLILGLILLVIGLIGALFVFRNLAVRSVQSVSQQTLTLDNLSNLPPLQVGDVILRLGVGADSLVIASISQSRFSHSGIVVATSPVVLVTHATTVDDAGISTYLQAFTQNTLPVSNALASSSEIAQTNLPQNISNLDLVTIQKANLQTKLTGDRVITMPLRFFVEQATDLAVVRYSELKPQMYPKLLDFLNQLEGYPFSLDSSNPQSIYCTTLIEKALNQVITTSLVRQYVEMPIFTGDYLFPEAFLHDQHAKVIFQYKAQTK